MLKESIPASAAFCSTSDLSDFADEKRMSFEILAGPPVLRRAGVEEDRFAVQISGGNVVDRATLSSRRIDHDAVEIRQRFESQLR